MANNTRMAITTKIQISAGEIPRTEPKRIPVAAEFAVWPRDRKRIPSPMAKAETAEVTLSWRAWVFSKLPIDKAAIIVNKIIPNNGAQPIKKPKEAPAKAISLNEWLKKLYDRATTNVPTIPATIEITVPAIKAFCIKACSNISNLLVVVNGLVRQVLS